MKMLDVPQSGSIGGVTSSHNRAGQYKRARRAPVSPTRTPKQGYARARFGAASALWQSMTPALQAAWTAFAHAYPVVDALGQTVVLTGQQYFVGINAQLLACGQPTSTVVPVNTTLNPVNTPTIYADNSGTVICTVASVTVGDFNKVSCSMPKSPGVSFNAQFSQFAVLSSTNLLFDISAAYVAQYGIPATGRKIFANFVEVNSAGMSANDNIISTVSVLAPVAAAPVATSPGPHTVISTGPGAGTLTVAFFQLNADGTGTFIAQALQTAGIATDATLTSGQSYYTRTLIAGVYGKASNIIVCT
jgi:hypothetical protein